VFFIQEREGEGLLLEKKKGSRYPRSGQQMFLSIMLQQEIDGDRVSLFSINLLRIRYLV